MHPKGILLDTVRDKFFNQEAIEARVDRILDLAQDYDAQLTFFVTAANVNSKNKHVLEKIVAAGHEIGSHSYQHINYAKIRRKDAYSQIKRSLDILNEYYSVVGFRAPYRIANEATLQACKDLNLKYSSSNRGRTFNQEQGLWDLPITQPTDYQIVHDKEVLDRKEIKRRWVDSAGEGEVLLFHPWRLGTSKHAQSLEEMLQQPVKFSALRDYPKNPKSCFLTFDLDFLEQKQVYLHTLRHLFCSPHLYQGGQ